MARSLISNRYKFSARKAKKRSSFFASFIFKRRFNKDRRDFWTSSFKNPYFVKHRMPKRTRAPRLKVIILIVCCAGIAAIFLFQPFFNINNVNISGLERISSNGIAGIVNKKLNQPQMLIFNGRNIFIVDLKSIQTSVKNEYALKNIQINKKFPNTLEIKLQEKTAQLILQNRDQFFLVDEEGQIIQQLPSNYNFLNNIPQFQIMVSGTIKIGEQVISGATEKFLIYLFQNVSKKTSVNITYANLMDQEGRVINLVTNEGWKIIVDRQNDWDKQMNVLAIILRDKIKNNRASLHYIDVRFENRSYFQ